MPLGHDSHQQRGFPGWVFGVFSFLLSDIEDQRGNHQGGIWYKLPPPDPGQCVRACMWRTSLKGQVQAHSLASLHFQSQKELMHLCWRGWPFILSWKSLMMLTDFHGQPYHCSTVQKASLWIVLKAMVRSMKTAYRSMFCLMHFSWTCLTVKTHVYGTVSWSETLLHLGRLCFDSDESVSSFLTLLCCFCFCRGWQSWHHGSPQTSHLPKCSAGCRGRLLRR